MPGFSNLRVQRSPLGLMLDKGKETLNILQLSQGEKSLISLVADISRRLILLNPSLDCPLDGQGVILIDEVDLHLHPRWQQEVITRLNRTFPNIQFIVSTHSPQILTTVRKENIFRVLNDGEDGTGIRKPLGASFGVSSSDALFEVMHVDPLSPLPEIEVYKKLASLIENDDLKGEFDGLLEGLKEALGPGHSLVLNIVRSIRRKKALSK